MTLKMGILDIPQSLVNIKLLDWLETHENVIERNKLKLVSCNFYNKGS